ncbi:replication initiation protein [Bacillus cereus]|uniref:replication initiation protein n=1 Tax=Bacillus cereus TaxID=1396 RepID=UPI000B4A923B|nr:replication initiation protein [Bacillus cereus]
MSVGIKDITTEQQTIDDYLPVAEIKPYYLVNQSNALLNAHQDLTLQERQIIFSLISLVQPEDKEMKTYILPVKDLAGVLGLTTKSFYSRVEKTVDSLQSKFFIIDKYDDRGKLIQRDKINWIQQATYTKGQVRVKLSDALAEYLLNLKSSFTKYHLYNVAQLRSDYSWRMYELLKEYLPLGGERKMTIAELRSKLGIPEGTLTETKNLKKVVLDRAKKELKEKTDICFTYKPYKKVGRRIESFVFEITRNTENINKNITKEAVDLDVRSLLKELMKYGISRNVASKFVKEHHPKYVEANLIYSLKQYETGKVESLTGLIVKAMSENYAKSDYSYAEADYESSLYSMASGDFFEKLKDKNRSDIDKLNGVVNFYNNKAQKAGKAGDIQEVARLGEERNKQCFIVLDEIHEARLKQNFPTLTEDDFDEFKQLLTYFNQWEERRREQFEVISDDDFVYKPIKTIQQIEAFNDEDLPY